MSGPARLAKRTFVTFHSTRFNTSEPKASYVNPHNYGEDVVEWLKSELSAKQIVGCKVAQEDYGWRLSFQSGGQIHEFILGYSADEFWLGWLERKRGMLGSMLGMRSSGIHAEAVNLIHSVLASANFVSNVRWHRREDFDGLREDLATPSPE